MVVVVGGGGGGEMRRDGGVKVLNSFRELGRS